MRSGIPALRDALVAAAARRARRRRRIALGVAAWSAAAAAAAVLLALAVSGPREREVPATTPEPGSLRGFSAFRRPATAADVPPADVVPPGARDVDSRLVLDAGGSRVWLFAYTRPKVEDHGGRRELCAAVRGTGGPGGVCPVPHDGIVSRVSRRGQPDSVLFVLPDGAGDPHATLSDGAVLAPALHENVALATPTQTVVGVSYTDPSGARRIARYQDLDARGWMPPQRCPTLEPLPAGAEQLARRAALLAVDAIYPGIQEATVTNVSTVGPGLCTRDVTDRSLMVWLHLTPFDASARSSASLTQGRLLLGVVDGEMTVWQVQH